MARDDKVCRPVTAIVLAAGCSTRMGAQKLLLPLGARPLVRWSVEAALASQATETIVVVGHESDDVARALDRSSVRLVANPDFAVGMSSSLQAGIRAVRRGSDAVLVLLADQPFVTAALLDALIARFEETGEQVIRPSYEGRAAHPVLMSAALFPEILRQQGDVGGRAVVERHAGEVGLLPVDDPWLIADIDTDEDYRAAREKV